MLAVLNRELGADFDLDAFEHVAFWDPENLWVDIRLRSLADQVVDVDGARHARRRSPPARRCGPRSRPSSPATGLEGIYAEAGLELADWWTDPDGPLRAQPRAARDLSHCHSGERRLVFLSKPQSKGESMKVFVAGATGALGKQLVPQLVARGHEVVGMTRSAVEARRCLRSLGARPVVADALDPDAVAQAVGAGRARGDRAPAHGAVRARSTCATSTATFALTNRLRTEGTDHLLAAGRAVGARRFVAQSFAGWPFARTGGPVKTEDDPLDPDPPAAMRDDARRRSATWRRR